LIADNFFCSIQSLYNIINENYFHIINQFIEIKEMKPIGSCEYR